MNPKKATQQAAFDMLRKLKGLDMSKVKGFSISVMLGESDDDDDDDTSGAGEARNYHTMPDGSEMEGKEHGKGEDNLPPKVEDEEEEEVVEEKDEDKKKFRVR